MLNEPLFRRLQKRCGQVRIENSGATVGNTHRLDPVTLRPRRQTGSGGEQYVVCCPFCQDSKYHLYVSYLYGEPNEVTDDNNLHLAICFRRDCLRDPGNRHHLANSLFGMLELPTRQTRPLLPFSDPKPLRPSVTAPGEIVALNTLSEDHPALVYLRGRGFDPEELHEEWGVGYCASGRFGPMQNRIYIPIHLGGKLVGWQGRALSEDVTPKYCNMPGFRKSEALYNFDHARAQPVVVVVEGVTDAWRVGRPAVAILGKKASHAQIIQLAVCSHKKPLLIALDGDARNEADQLARELKPVHEGGVVVVPMPVGCDPGGLERDKFWDIVRGAAKEQCVSLPPLTNMSVTTDQISDITPQCSGSIAPGNV
jgi:DNA primase catalytic core, N-terminal domain